MSGKGRRTTILACILLACAWSAGQDKPVQQSLNFSKDQVEKALQQMQAYPGGKLPTLEGFVAAGDRSLDQYKRGYYQYTVKVTPQSANQVSVQVSAKITAWYAGENGRNAGYQALPSNGRLESDLLDRLEEALRVQVGAGARAGGAKTASSATETVEPKIGERGKSVFKARDESVAKLPTRQESAAIAAEQSNQHIQELNEEAKNLEEILKSQSRPDNLVAIRDDRTPVYSRPLDTSTVLFMADAQDEFQLVEEEGTWVHVQISGISRGWIHRAQVEMPQEARRSASDPEDEKRQKEMFRQTREETSTFPGEWEPLKGKTVKIIWVQPTGVEKADQDSRLSYAKTVFRKTFPELTKIVPNVAGVVIVFDSQDGGMAATTTATLQQWHAGHLTDNAFWKRCWLDPADAFKEKE